MARIAVYARCSTTDQTLNAQLHQLREYASRRGAEAIEFADHGVSGAHSTRPGLDALMAAARRHIVTGWQGGRAVRRRNASGTGYPVPRP